MKRMADYSIIRSERNRIFFCSSFPNDPIGNPARRVNQQHISNRITAKAPGSRGNRTSLNLIIPNMHVSSDKNVSPIAY